MSVTFRTFKPQHLRKLGYPAAEAAWIAGFRDARMFDPHFDCAKYNLSPSSSALLKHGHTGGTYNYTKEITRTIEHHQWVNWAPHHVHVPYDDFFNIFLLGDNISLGYAMIGHPFTSMRDHHALEIFRQQYMPDAPKELKRLLYLYLAKRSDISNQLR